MEFFLEMKGKVESYFPVSEARRVSGKGFGVLGCCWVWGFGPRRNLHFNFNV